MMGMNININININVDVDVYVKGFVCVCKHFTYVCKDGEVSAV